MSVLEGTGFVELILTKSDGAVGAVSVNINTVDGTAGLRKCIKRNLIFASFFFRGRERLCTIEHCHNF